jgi:hypothetical protein
MSSVADDVRILLQRLWLPRYVSALGCESVFCGLIPRAVILVAGSREHDETPEILLLPPAEPAIAAS